MNWFEWVAEGVLLSQCSVAEVDPRVITIWGMFISYHIFVHNEWVLTEVLLMIWSYVYQPPRVGMLIFTLRLPNLARMAISLCDGLVSNVLRVIWMILSVALRTLLFVFTPWPVQVSVIVEIVYNLFFIQQNK